jgi:hypothetical protein
MVLPARWSSRIHLPASLCSARITGLHRSYGRSDSSRCHPSREVSPIPTSSLLTVPSPPTQWTPSTPLTRFLRSGHWVFRLSCRLRLRPTLAGSPLHMAVSSSSSYGLVVHLRLLSTPPRGDAGTFDCRQESVCPVGTSTPLSGCPFGRTRDRPEWRSACLRGTTAPRPRSAKLSTAFDRYGQLPQHMKCTRAKPVKARNPV